MLYLIAVVTFWILGILHCAYENIILGIILISIAILFAIPTAEWLQLLLS